MRVPGRPGIPDAIYRIIGGSVQFEDVEGRWSLNLRPGFTGIAGLPSLSSRVQAIDGFGKDTGTGGFANSPLGPSAKQVGVRQLVCF
jgi:hypothetical protein